MYKIVFVVHTFDVSQMGGVLKITSLQANELVERGWDVTILSLGKTEYLAHPLDKRVKLEDLNLKYYDTRQLKGWRKVLWFSKVYFPLKKFIKHFEGKAVFVTTSPPLNLLFALFGNKSKVIGCDHTATTYNLRGLQFFINLLKRRLNYMVGLTPEDTRYYINNNIKAQYIPNFIERNSS